MKQIRALLFVLVCAIVTVSLWFFSKNGEIINTQRVVPGQKGTYVQVKEAERTLGFAPEINTVSLSSNKQRVVAVEQNKDDWMEIAGQKFSVLFEATNVSNDMRKAIIADVELNFSLCTNVSVIAVALEPNNPYQKLYITPISHLLIIEPRSTGLIAQGLEMFGGAHQKDSHYQVVIHGDLIKTYIKAQAFIEAHSGMFPKLNEFLSQLRDKAFVTRLENGPKDGAKKYVEFERDAGPDFNYEKWIAQVKKIPEIRQPSLLDFWCYTNKGKSAVVCASVIKYGEKKFVKGTPLFIFIDEQWKLFMPAGE